MSDESLRIDVIPGGPYVLSGPAAVRPARPVVSEDGEPMTWSFDDGVTTDAALCRCGQSGSKPFCDGSHNDVEIAEGSPPEGTFDDRARSIEGTGLTLLDDTKLCMHAGFCGTAKTTVWKMMKDTDDPRTRGVVMRMVEKCPSGRLVNVVDDEAVEPWLPEGVGVVPDGPLWVTGGIEVAVDDTTIETRNRVTLCRCGRSGKAPLCDGSHSDAGFEHDGSIADPPG